MKLSALTALLAGFLACAALQAQQPQSSANAQPQYSSKKEFITICFFLGVPSSAENVVTNGLKVGAPISFGAPVNGMEASVFASATDKVAGVQCSIISNIAEKVEGLQFGIVNFTKDCDGLQLGIFNSASGESFQIGILNHIEGAAVPWLPIFNVKF